MKRVLRLFFPILLACGSDDPVAPQSPPENPPENPTGTSGFSLLTLLHGSRSSAFSQVRDVAVDGQGNVFVTGGTSDPNFPTTPNAYQRQFGQGQSATSTGSLGNWDVFVMKFAPDGQLVWSTLLGGGNYDRAYALEVTAQGVYVAGRAGAGFPTTAGVIQPNFAGDNIRSGTYGQQDGFIAKLSLDGASLIWATYFGSNQDDFLRDLTVGPDGDVYPAVSIAKSSFPYITSGAFQPTHGGQGDAAACRLNSTASAVRWCTFIGGSGADGNAPSVRLDATGNVYLLQSLSSADAPVSPGAAQSTHGGGADEHLTKLSPQGALIFATYFGGRGGEGNETHNLWVTPSGEAFIAAHTTSPDLPTTSGALRRTLSGGSDAFVARISPDGRQILAATYLGGSAGDEAEGVGMDAVGNVVISGSTTSHDFPGLGGAPQALNGGGQDAFIAVLPPNLGSVRASFIGGKSNDVARAVAVDAARNTAYAGGTTVSADFPTNATSFMKQHSGGEDAFLAGWRLR